MDRNKELGQVWTPDWLVCNILDNIGYTCDNPAIINSKIMEPSFGAGAFLIEITRRLIDACKRYGMKTSDIEDTVNRNIYGIEYDANIFMQTLQSLKLLCSSYGFNVPFNNLVRMDALDYNPAVDFDYIVGNPPYVKIQSLSNDMREKCQNYQLHLEILIYILPFMIYALIGLNWMVNYLLYHHQDG